MNKRIAVVFDFDETLGPDSTTAFLAEAGLDTEQFWTGRVQPMIEDGWDPVPAYLYRMIDESQTRPVRDHFTKERFERFGRSQTLYRGVARLFSNIRKRAQAGLDGVEVEFFLISSGIGEILRATRIARHFRDIWACDFSYGAAGEILFPKRIVSFTDKTRYLFQITKGLFGPESRGRPFDVNRRVDDGDLFVPMNQMIYVGDGFTDVPCFSLIKKAGGVPIGVFDSEAEHKWVRRGGSCKKNAS